jgi:hypothetical protein
MEMAIRFKKKENKMEAINQYQSWLPARGFTGAIKEHKIKNCGNDSELNNVCVHG